MSNFNEANEFASELVFGRTYQGNEPTTKPERLVFVSGDSTAVVTAHEESDPMRPPRIGRRVTTPPSPTRQPWHEDIFFRCPQSRVGRT